MENIKLIIRESYLTSVFINDFNPTFQFKKSEYDEGCKLGNKIYYAYATASYWYDDT